MYLVWQDTTAKKPLDLKIREGIERYQDRFGSKPIVILMNEEDLKPIAGYIVASKPYIRRNTFWFELKEQ